MERNSRDFRRRTRVVNKNAEAVCEFLKSRAIGGGVIKEVFYPKYITRENYEFCRIKNRPEDREGREDEEGGFGGLFSLTFTTPEASRAFFDALPFHKGPGLGTNFTLACPYTILAHYGERVWAGEYGVEEGLVRVSVGMEETGVLVSGFEKALEVAESSKHK